MISPWIKNTAGKPDSQLTFLALWNLVGVGLCVLTVATAKPVDVEVWCFVGAAMGLKAASYVSRRKQSDATAADERDTTAGERKPLPVGGEG